MRFWCIWNEKSQHFDSYIRSVREIKLDLYFRSISRVYLSSGEEPVGGGRGWRRDGEEPRLTSWRRTHDESLLNSSNNSSLLRRMDGHESFSKDSSLPSYTSETNLPPIPARRPSAAGDSAPNRPPKPNRSNNNTDDEDSKKDKDSNNSDSSIWYEYGCVWMRSQDTRPV